MLAVGVTAGILASASDAEMVTDAAMRAVITAIEDEIYANGYQTAYIDVGADKVPVYFNPRIENGMIWVIYKLMPFGEIRRAAVLSPDKQLAMLQRDPRLGFPASDGSATKTVYLRDEDVIEMKTTWRKVYMSIELKPSNRRIEAAKQREAIRYRSGR
jgi:hypothetical protein